MCKAHGQRVMKVILRNFEILIKIIKNNLVKNETNFLNF